MKLKINGMGFIVNEDGSAIRPEQREEIVRAVNSSAALLETLQGYERMSEKFTAISKEIEKLQTALEFIAPMTRSVIASAEGK